MRAILVCLALAACAPSPDDATPDLVDTDAIDVVDDIDDAFSTDGE